MMDDDDDDDEGEDDTEEEDGRQKVVLKEGSITLDQVCSMVSLTSLTVV